MPDRESGGAAGRLLEALVAVRQLRRGSFSGSPAAPAWGGRRQSGGSGGGSSAAAVRQLRRIVLPELSCRAAAELDSSPAAQLREYIPFLLHVVVHYGLQRVKFNVPFPQFFSTMAEITPTRSLYLLWKYQRHQTQSL